MDDRHEGWQVAAEALSLVEDDDRDDAVLVDEGDQTALMSLTIRARGLGRRSKFSEVEDEAFIVPLVEGVAEHRSVADDDHLPLADGLAGDHGPVLAAQGRSTRFVAYKDRKAVCAALKPIYTAPSREAAEAALEAFDSEWGERYPIITQSWMEHWERLVPFLDFPEEIRRAIYTTNAIASINSQIRKYIKNRGHFPDDKSALKLIYLALRNAEKKWTMPIRNWKLALNQLAIKFEGRLPL